MSPERIPAKQLEDIDAVENQLDSILGTYKSELEDSLLQELAEEVKNAPDKKVLRRLEEFLKSLREYHDSYDGLKAAARKERLMYLDDIEKFKQGVKNADAREKILHDNVMSSANILSRTMKKAGLDITWRGNKAIYHLGGTNDSSDQQARDMFREWMFCVYHEVFSGPNSQ